MQTPEFNKLERTLDDIKRKIDSLQKGQEKIEVKLERLAKGLEESKPSTFEKIAVGGAAAMSLVALSEQIDGIHKKLEANEKAQAKKMRFVEKHGNVEDFPSFKDWERRAEEHNYKVVKVRLGDYRAVAEDSTVQGVWMRKLSRGWVKSQGD